MGDLLGSLTKPHTVRVRWLNGDNISWKGTRGSPVEGFKPCPVGVVTRMEKEIFGNEYNAYIVREDIENFCHLQAISTGCIAVYMRYITCKLISLIYIYI